MDMTQDERWLTKYNEVKNFIETNKRNPFKFMPEERGLRKLGTTSAEVGE